MPPRKSKSAPALQPEMLSLLKAVKDAPDEDAPRLVLADWLEEHGDEAQRGRAELIRLQCESWRQLPHAPHFCVRSPREKELEERYGAEWVASLGGGVKEVTYERGLARVKVYARSFLGKRMTALAGKEAWAWVEQAAPVVASGADHWTGPGWRAGEEPAHPQLAEVLRSPLLKSVRKLELSWVLLNAGDVDVLARARLGHVRELGLGYDYLDAPGTAALAGIDWFRNLTALDLQQNQLRAEGARALAEATNLTNLEELNLVWDLIGPEGMAALASSPHFPHMRRLNLYGNHIRDAGAQALVEAPLWDRLTHLALSACMISDAGVRALASSPRSAHLIVLELRGNTITDGGARDLASSPYLDNLQVLDVRQTRIGEEGATALRARFGERVWL
jgi:uncharacterized protein (TIGR02996 family)